MSSTKFGKNEFIACCGSTKFAEQMVANGPFLNYNEAVAAANDIWFNKVDISGWLEAFAAHPQIGQNPSATAHKTSANWSKGEQSTALATATDSTLQELYEWNSRYMQKFGFVLLICASGRTTPEILSELKRRFSNRPIVEFENAAQEQMKITELRLQKLFSNKEFTASTQVQSTASDVTKAEGRVTILGSHLTAPLTTSDTKSAPKTTRTRPPITTHVLDVARGCPASGIEVMLEMYSGANLAGPVFGNVDNDKWILHGSSTTDKDGRSGQLMKMVNDLSPGVYRISFNTGKYNPHGFFPFVSIVFEIKESQKNEHFHVPLLLSPFSFSTYRGS
ncbi:uric acid degradation bifunctional protein TTL-like isoform X2 [Rutidosis leptorrhynchoides]|uniref:uric acid degradation bifunctional protein TTL-like isoform X2 n=1 Tax=Rutidosis leptorrhynchoides TaxID=125765 RepID=UPI003A9A355D